MNKELYKEIDLIVRELIKNGVISEYKQAPELRSSAIRFLKANNFIKTTEKRLQYNPTSEIYEIQKVGIKMYLLHRQEEKATEKTIREKTLFDLKNKYLINFVFLLIGSLFGWYLTNISESNNHKESAELLNKIIAKKRDSLIQTQIQLNEKNTLILSLKKEVDSLKAERIN